jgi:hypothetical protein
LTTAVAGIITNIDRIGIGGLCVATLTTGVRSEIMKWISMIIALCSAFTFVDVQAMEAGYCDCYGGVQADSQYWKLIDHEGKPLEDGDWVYAAWTGPDGQIDPPDAQGNPTDDDVRLPVASERVEYSTFFLVVTTWREGSRDTSGHFRHPMDDELIYCRIFDGPEGSISPGDYYADSQLHRVTWKMGDVFFCLFPGDPGGGRTHMPVPESGRRKTASSSKGILAAELRQIYPQLQCPMVELEYTVPQDVHVTLNIYEYKGHMVATVVDAQKKVGSYTERWNPGDVPSGIYIAELRAGDVRILRKIILIRL